MNQFVIAVYRSRNVSTKVYNYLYSHGITCALISTPRSANVGCGLSVKFRASDLDGLRQQLSQVETFAGFFVVRNTAGGTVVTRL